MMCITRMHPMRILMIFCCVYRPERNCRIPVSYTHLDVYKRQMLNRLPIIDASMALDGASSFLVNAVNVWFDIKNGDPSRTIRR